MVHRKKLVALLIAFGPPALLLATPANRSLLFTSYPNAPVSGMAFRNSTSTCNTCHFYGEGPAQNPFAQAWVAADYDFASIEQADSDGDGVSNIDELTAGTNPGANPQHLIDLLLGKESSSLPQPNVNGDVQPEGEQVLDAADLVFRFSNQ